MAEDPKRDRTAGDGRANLLGDPLAMYCLGCRYPLRGLTGGACPECGRGFDPDDPATYSPTAKRYVYTVPFDAASAKSFSAPLIAMFYLMFLAPRSRRSHAMSSPHLPLNYNNTLFTLVFLFAFALLAFVVLNFHHHGRRLRTDAWVAGMLFLGLAASLSLPLVTSLYIYSASAGMVIVNWRRALSVEAWCGRRLAWAALLIAAAFLTLASTSLTVGLDEIYDYWTYWVWTTQW